MTFVRIEPGVFQMGSPLSEPFRAVDEVLHEVKIGREFWLGQFEVTQEQWTGVMGGNPSYHSTCGPRCPVESVTWFDVQQFLAKLNAASKESKFRLPTEGEWEYTCRAGTKTAFSTGDGIDQSQARFDVHDGPVAAGSYSPNAWGLYDMHGNVWEWTDDWYAPYSAGPQIDPKGPQHGEKKVIRGGSWYFGADSARCALRYTHSPGDRGFSLGFRVVREIR
jgi:formylglycine-generating enzyme required for sulfatase activity